MAAMYCKKCGAEGRRSALGVMVRCHCGSFAFTSGGLVKLTKKIDVESTEPAVRSTEPAVRWSLSEWDQRLLRQLRIKVDA